MSLNGESFTKPVRMINSWNIICPFFQNNQYGNDFKSAPYSYPVEQGKKQGGVAVENYFYKGGKNEQAPYFGSNGMGGHFFFEFYI